MKTAKNLTILFFISFIIYSLSTTVYAQKISIEEDQITCARFIPSGNYYTLYPDLPITFPIRYTNNTSIIEKGMANGFLIYLDNDRNGIPDPDGTFGPVSADINDEYPLDSGYFDFFEPRYIDIDGLGIDTIGFVGFAAYVGTGVPAGFDGIAAYISVGSLNEGDRICIDSSYFPPAGSWMWGTLDTPPQWGGPYCYDVEMSPCLWDDFYNTPDTFIVNSCEPFNYKFIEVSCFEYNYEIIEGPGTISNDALYAYQLNSEDNGTVQSVRIVANDIEECINHQWEVNIPIKIEVDTSLFTMPGDVNTDCQSDIEDLVFLIEYQFKGGAAPLVFALGDCNGSGVIDVEDLVYLIEYQFHDGPSPIVPW